nr:hypothetical protein Iba_chr11aCG12660 [Ipomoea batatas]
MVAAPSGSKPAQLSSFGETNAWPRPTPCHLARPRIWPSPHRKEAFWSDEKMKESMPGGRKIERIKESGRGNKEESLLPLFMGVGEAGQHTATAAGKSRHIPGQEYLPLRLGKVERKRYGGGKTKCATHNQEAREKAMGVEDQLSGFKTTVSNSEPELCGNQCKSLEGQVSPFGEKRALNEYYKEEPVESTIEKRGSGFNLEGRLEPAIWRCGGWPGEAVMLAVGLAPLTKGAGGQRVAKEGVGTRAEAKVFPLSAVEARDLRRA